MSTQRLITIGLLGFGNVGSGALRALQDHQREIAARFDGQLRIKAICSPTIDQRDTSWVDAGVIRTTDPRQLIEDPEIEILVEAIGGEEPARSYLLQAIERGKSVVTANKLLLARAGRELSQAAAARGVTMGIEAAVAGGIPILNAIREGLAGERIEAVYGILNGTTNFILTEMEKTSKPFAEILATAQALGYAEANPTLDVEGLDARDKLAIISMLSFGTAIDVDAIPTSGITRLRPVDFIYANQMGYTIRLLCAARQTINEKSDRELTISVSPALVPQASILAKVDGSFNAILLTGAAGGRTMYYGRGAGAGPTGIAIVSDIIRIARERLAGTANLSAPFSFRELTPQTPTTASTFLFPYSLRFVVDDRPGIIAQLAAILAKYQINIDAVLQEKSYENKRELPFVITLEPTSADQLEQALAEMQQLEFLTEPPLALRIEDLA